jgi:hypothetical protein
VFDDPQGQRVVFQVWNWQPDGRTYQVHLFILRDTAGTWQTSHYAATYRALLRDECTAILHAAGLQDIRWHLPEATGYFQPLVTARRV